MREADRQLLLPFSHAPGYDSRDFLPAESNRQALAWLDSSWPDDRLALWGPPGCGKSHLLHIWAARSGAVTLSGPALRDLDVVPAYGALTLDDADNVVAEPLLLHLLNTARDRGLKILLSGRLPPSRWPVRLPDLASRLRAVTAVELRPPDDALLAALLVRLLADRQLSVAEPVQAWLLTRLPRSPAALREAVARLDRTSLRIGKPITRTLAGRIVREAGFDATDADEDSMAGLDPSSQAPGFL